METIFSLQKVFFFFGFFFFVFFVLFFLLLFFCLCFLFFVFCFCFFFFVFLWIWDDKFQVSFEWEMEKYECSPVYFHDIFRDLGYRDNGYQPSVPQYPLYSVVPSVHGATCGQL